MKECLTGTNLDSSHAGTALAALNVFSDTQLLPQWYQLLQEEVNSYINAIDQRPRDVPVAPLRAWGIELADRCLLLAALLSPKCNSLSRIFAENRLVSIVTFDSPLLKAVIKRQQEYLVKLSEPLNTVCNIPGDVGYLFLKLSTHGLASLEIAKSITKRGNDALSHLQVLHNKLIELRQTTILSETVLAQMLILVQMNIQYAIQISGGISINLTHPLQQIIKDFLNTCAQFTQHKEWLLAICQAMANLPVHENIKY